MSADEGTPQHVADRAGGEEIVYSSDGLDPLPLPAQTIRSRMRDDDKTVNFGSVDAVEGVTDRVFQSETLPATQAFEMFAGKLYAPATSTSVSSSSSWTRRVGPETFLQRLARLQNELNELQQSVSAVSSKQAQNKEGDEESKLLETETELLTQLRNQWIQTNDLLKERKAGINARLASAVKDLGDGTVPATIATDTSAVLSGSVSGTALEERLARLEQLVGTKNNTSTGRSIGSRTMSSATQLSFMDRLAALERIQSKLDDKQSDLLQKRAKVIRQDLEAAAKARNKLLQVTSTVSGTGTGPAGMHQYDGKTITDLYDLSVQLQGMSDHLPALVQRLQSLAHLHADAATWAGRLHATELQAQQLQSQVTSLEQAVDTMEATVKENSTLMNQNLSSLDERMKKLQS